MNVCVPSTLEHTSYIHVPFFGIFKSIIPILCTYPWSCQSVRQLHLGASVKYSLICAVVLFLFPFYFIFTLFPPSVDNLLKFDFFSRSIVNTTIRIFQRYVTRYYYYYIYFTFIDIILGC